jgi:UDP-N-acetyl-2-amino-2-deoxyglucuronate dehydrogenase
MKESVMEQVRFGIVGVGTQGGFYARMLTENPPPGCVLGALADNDPARETSSRELYRNVPCFADWRELVASGQVDAVIVSVPHYLHPEVAMHCLNAGMPVLVEKPAGVYAKQVREMNECAAAHPEVPFAIMFNQRTNQLYQQVRDLVVSGELGEIRRSNWIINTWWRPDSYYQQSEWRATWGGEGGGVLVNQAPHQLDLWQWICGVPTKVYAKIRFGAHREIVVDNDVTMVVEYPNGATGTFVTSTHDPMGTDRFEIDLDGGRIVVDRSEKATVWRLHQNEATLNETMDMMALARLTMSNSAEGAASLYSEEIIESRDAWGVQHRTVIGNFGQHLLEGTPLLAPGADGIHGVNLANAALLSAWLGREVENPVDEDLFVAELNKRIADEGRYPLLGSVAR